MNKINFKLSIIAALFATTLLFSAPSMADTNTSALPDRAVTKGALSGLVTQENIHETICVKGYTKTIRPPASYTSKLKKIQLRALGYEDVNPSHNEEEHDMPLSLGGHPTDLNNLYPQIRYACKGNEFNCSQEDRYTPEWNADKKDDLERRLQHLVCHGDISLREAQMAIHANWVDAYKKYGGEKYHGNGSAD